MIDRALKLPFKDPIETYSSSDHIYTGLGIPPGTTGQLPKAGRTREGLAAEGVEDLGETGKKKPKLDDRGHSHGKSNRPDNARGDKAKSDRSKDDKPKGDKAKGDKAKGDKPAADRPQRPRQRTRGGKPATEV